MLNAIDIGSMPFACLFYVIKFQKSAKSCTKCAHIFKNCLNTFTMITMDPLYHLYESTLNIDGKRLMICNLAKSIPFLIPIFPDPLCVDSWWVYT